MYQGTGVLSIACMAHALQEKISNGLYKRKDNITQEARKLNSASLDFRSWKFLSQSVLGAMWAANPAVGRIPQNFTKH